jgi:tetratricopeptide (TPR) repeat protein
MPRYRPPDYLPRDVLDREDFVAACAERNLGVMFKIAKKWAVGFTPSHLARRCELTVSRVLEYMSGRYEARGLQVFERVSDGLHIPGHMLGLARRSWEAREADATFIQPAAKSKTPESIPRSGPSLIQSPEAGTQPTDGGRSGEQPQDVVVLNLRLDGREVAVPLSRRLLLQAGVGSLAEAFSLGQQLDHLRDIVERPGQTQPLTIASSAHFQEILFHLREQWHALVKTDNLLGPRFALTGVLEQISVVESLRSVVRDEQRIEVVRLGAKYAESAAWLYEDSNNLGQAHYWTSQAMEWAYEGNDDRMLAWTIFRRAQQAAATPNPAQVIGLSQAARRDEDKLAIPTRAAIRVQEAYGHALDGNERAAQRLLDEAHTWAAGDTVGDAHQGHGSYCTPSYIEIQRANCWLTTGRPRKAIALYEEGLRTLPAVYQRNRAATLSRLARAYTADGQPEQAASTAHKALPVARSSGSKRILGELADIGNELIPHRQLPAVAALLDELDLGDH